MSLPGNFHTHTRFCDGADTAEDMVQQAIRLGFRHLGFSGHMDPDIHMDRPAYLREIRRLQAAYADKIEILCGIELDNIYDPREGEGAEYLIGSTHFLDVPPLDGEWMSVDSTEANLRKLAETYFGGDYYKLSAAYYDFEAKVYDRLHCTFAGHFDLVTRFNDSLHFLDEENPAYYRPAMDAMEYLVSEGVPLEINCGAVNRGRKKQFYPNSRLLKALHDFGGEIIINTDAHQKEKLAAGMREAAQQAAAAGFTHTCILTKEGSGKVHFRQIPLDLYF